MIDNNMLAHYEIIQYKKTSILLYNVTSPGLTYKILILIWSFWAKNF